MVTINEFANIDLRVGKIVEIDDLEGARGPIYRAKVDLGELGIRNIAMGLKDVYSKEELLNRLVIVVANLEPKKIANFISEGMLLAAEDGTGTISLLQPDKNLKPGSKIR
ncbi:MAG: tRNA-binding protein [Candidatus Micrarchaeaceae archaeon]